MSEFWRYFHDRLAWPLIHAPGPLAGLVRGLALSLDSARDDSVYFRHQWFPKLCEAELVPDFGKSRGLVRHPKENAEAFRSRVVNAWRWHQLGGRTEGLPEILKFYGFEALRLESLRRYQPSRWAEFQIGLKTPATQAEQDALLADLDTLLWLVNEYKPARSLLARVYTDTYDRVPTVWSGGPVEEQGWSNGFWSRFSGVLWPGQDGDIVVSFGMIRRFQSERYNDSGAGLGVESRTGFLAPYIDRPVWSRSAWSDVFPRNHGFTIGALVSLHWERELLPWIFRQRSFAKVEAVYSWPGDGEEPGTPVTVHGNGTWGDVNACYGRPQAVIYQGTRWGDVWGADPLRREWEILERWRHRTPVSCPAVTVGIPRLAGESRLAVRSASPKKDGWEGPWRGREWRSWRLPCAVTSQAALHGDEAEREAPRLSGDVLLAVTGAAPAAIAYWCGEETVPHLSGPLHERRWLGSSAGRRWYDYTGLTSIKEQTE